MAVRILEWFGGYAALINSLIEPNLFKYTVGAMGVYNLSLMRSTGGIVEPQTGENYLAKAIGNDEAKLKMFSPARRADALNLKACLWDKNDRHQQLFPKN